jgi:hypothetical protein
METIVIRIRLTDFKEMKKIFKSYKGETASSYFYRLKNELELLEGLKERRFGK